jgi:hypothetical protein
MTSDDKRLEMENLISAIVKLAIKVTLETQHDVFVNISGHVEWVEISIYEGGWKQLPCSCQQMEPVRIAPFYFSDSMWDIKNSS